MADFLRNIKLLKILIIFNVLVLFSLFVFGAAGFLIYYVSLPEDAPLRAQIQLGKKSKVFEFGHIFYDHRKLGLPVYDLELSKNDIKRLISSLPPQGQRLTEEYRQEVGADFFYNKKKYRVDTRIKGLLPNHWQGAKKSWRIKFKKDDLFNGQKEINLILPEDRFFIGEHLENYIAKKMGLFTAESRFVFLRINGQLQGIYFEIEDPTEKFLERSFKINPANLYKDTDFASGPYGQRNIYEDVAYWKKKLSINQNKEDGDYSDLDYLISLVSLAPQEKFDKEIESILNVDKFLKLDAIWMMLGDLQWDQYHNGLFYFDPINGKFEPLRWDFNQQPLDDAKFFDRDFNPLVTKLLRNPAFLHKRNQILWTYLHEARNLKDDLNFYDQTYKKIRAGFYVDRKKEYTNWAFDRNIKKFKEILLNNCKKIVKDLSFCQIFVHIKKPILQTNNTQRGSLVATLDIKSSGFSAATFKGAQIALDEQGTETGEFLLYYDADGSGVSSKADTLMGSLQRKSNSLEFESKDNWQDMILYPERDGQLQPLARNYRFFLIEPRFSSAQVSQIRLSIINAVTNEISEPVYRFVDEGKFIRLPEISQTEDDFLKSYPFFVKDVTQSGTFSLPNNKVFDILQTIIVPKGVTIKISAGTILRFAPDTSLISFGRMLVEGSVNNPAVFTALQPEKTRGVVAVVGKGSAGSYFKNAIFEYSKEFIFNEIYFSGSLAVHDSQAEIENCIFRNNKSDDAINIKSSNAVISKSVFRDNISDSIDIDYSTGLILSNLVENSAGDGIDLCNSHLLILNNVIKAAGDKGISIGEDSSPKIINNIILESNIGLGIKDNSNPLISNNVVVNNKVGISAYRKKNVFGGARGLIQNMIIWGNDLQVETDKYSTLEIAYSLVQGGYKNGREIVDRTPLFKAPEKMDFSLKDIPENKILFSAGTNQNLPELFTKFKAVSKVQIGILPAEMLTQ